MQYVGGPWTRLARLAVGGNPSPASNGVPGGWQYKFYYSGVGDWPNDPLNHHINPRDPANNTFVYVKDPTIFHFLPNQRYPVGGIVTTTTPQISAYIYPKVGATVDTASITLSIDGIAVTGLGADYSFSTKQLVYALPSPLLNGPHTVVLQAASKAGGMNADTVSFYVRTGFVQLLNQSRVSTWESQWTLYGSVNDATVGSAKVVRNGVDTFSVSVVNKSFVYAASLVEGTNMFTAVADSAGVRKVSSPVAILRMVNHSPWAVISYGDSGSTITLRADSSSDPDSGQSALLSFRWSVDQSNPFPISGVDGSTLGQIAVAKPAVPGEYYFGLIATDPDGHSDTTRNYFTINSDGSVSYSTLAGNPSWDTKQNRRCLL